MRWAVDPRRRVEVAEAFLRRGMEHVGEDPVQACEKLYKAAEEALKALAEVLQLEAFQKAARRRRWTSSLYREAAVEAAERLGIDVFSMWSAAWVLYVEGFHEMSLKPDEIELHVEKIEKLIGLARRPSASMNIYSRPLRERVRGRG